MCTANHSEVFEICGQEFLCWYVEEFLFYIGRSILVLCVGSPVCAEEFFCLLLRSSSVRVSRGSCISCIIRSLRVLWCLEEVPPFPHFPLSPLLSQTTASLLHWLTPSARGRGILQAPRASFTLVYATAPRVYLSRVSSQVRPLYKMQILS